jgi:predicted RNA-binding protein with PIN domain
VLVIVDAMNVLGSRPDGWWRDRDGALRRLVAQLDTWAATHDDEVLVVADGRPVEGLPAGRTDHLEVLYADRAGPDAADDRIVEVVADLADLPGPGDRTDAGRVDGEAAAAAEVTVVTADRALRDHVTDLGAQVHGPRWLLTQLG